MLGERLIDMKTQSRKKVKRRRYSCFEPNVPRSINPIEFLKRWGRNIKHSYQRIQYGYCDRDVWSIDWWFLNVVPNMLEDLKNQAHGYPVGPNNNSQALIGTGTPEEVDNAGMKAWQDILSEMTNLLREANEETCTRNNKYEEEFFNSRKGSPGYKEIDKRYFEEERAISEYRTECKDKALELFKKWFWQLWD